MNDQVKEPEMSAEQAADLARLELAANEPDQAVQQLADAQAEQQEQVEQSLVEKNAAALSMVSELAVPVFSQFGFPTVARVLSDPAEGGSGLSNGQLLATVWAPVLTKYGVNLDLMGDKWKLEIAAVFVTIPIAKALYVAVHADTSKGRAAAAPQVAARVDQPKAVPQQVLGTADPE